MREYAKDNSGKILSESLGASSLKFIYEDLTVWELPVPYSL